MAKGAGSTGSVHPMASVDHLHVRTSLYNAPDVPCDVKRASSILDKRAELRVDLWWSAQEAQTQGSYGQHFCCHQTRLDRIAKMVPISAISVLSIVMMAARNELSVVTLKIFKICGVAETFKKISTPRLAGRECMNPVMPGPFLVGRGITTALSPTPREPETWRS